MRLKDIKREMVVHCKTKDEMEELSKHIKFCVSVEHIWNYGNDGIRRDCIWFDKGKYVGFGTYNYFENEKGYEIIEFSDLIMPEMTAEEALLAYDQMCRENYCCNDCPIYGILGHECAHEMEGHISEIMDAIKKWKSDHEKKEPEIEWVYRVFGAENFGEKFFQTEEEAINRCEELAKSQKTKQYARYERVCRVKAVK